MRTKFFESAIDSGATAIALAANNSLVAAVREYFPASPNLYVWSLPDFKKVAAEFEKANSLDGLWITPDGRSIWSSHPIGSDYHLIAWDALTGKLLADFPAHRNRTLWMTFSADSRLAATASWDGTGRVWDLQRKTLVFEMRSARRSIEKVAFSPDVRRLVTSATDRSVAIWDVNSKLAVGSFGSAQFDEAWFLDANTLAALDGRTLTLLRADPLESIDYTLSNR